MGWLVGGWLGDEDHFLRALIFFTKVSSTCAISHWTQWNDLHTNPQLAATTQSEYKSARLFLIIVSLIHIPIPYCSPYAIHFPLFPFTIHQTAGHALTLQMLFP